MAEYEYNGLHCRTLRDHGIDERNLFCYSSDRQLIEEHRHEYDSLPGTMERVAQQFWGLRYIDDAVSRRVDANADGDYVDHLVGDPPLEGEGVWFHLTDVQFSVVALTTETGGLTERVAYDAYGRARHRWHSDLDGDGDSDYADYTEQVAANFTDIHADPEYRPDADHNRDGDVDNDDLFEFLTGASQTALTYGLISDPLGPDNPIGYDGYVFAPEAGIVVGTGGTQPQALGAYCVRFRWYLPETGRWLERDPAGYAFGTNWAEYLNGQPLAYTDPMGLGPVGSPEWNHLFPQQVFKDCGVALPIDINAAQYGTVFAGAHGGATHTAWNEAWAATWSRWKTSGQPLTQELFEEELKRMLADPKYADWLAESAPAGMCYGDWGNLSPTDKINRATDLLEENTRVREGLMTRMADRLSRLQAGPVGRWARGGLKGVTFILIPALIVTQAATTNDAFAVCVVDNALLPPGVTTQDVREFIQEGQGFVSDFMSTKRDDVHGGMMRGTNARSDCCEPPLEGEYDYHR